MEYRILTERYDKALSDLIRKNLRAHQLDLPGTVYFDEGLDHLSSFYSRPGRAYFCLLREGELMGGAGLAEFSGFPDACELQKLYLDPEVQGRGLGYQMLEKVEQEGRKPGYMRMYLETHTNLQAAIHLYEKAGYLKIPRPDCVVHSSMNRFYLKEL